MGRVGSALDNAAAESFNSTLEHELLSRRRFAHQGPGPPGGRRVHRRLQPSAPSQLLRDAPTRRLRRRPRRMPQHRPTSRRRRETSLSDRLRRHEPDPGWHQGCGRMRGFNHQSETLHGSGGSPVQRGARRGSRTPTLLTEPAGLSLDLRLHPLGTCPPVRCDLRVRTRGVFADPSTPARLTASVSNALATQASLQVDDRTEPAASFSGTQPVILKPGLALENYLPLQRQRANR